MHRKDSKRKVSKIIFPRLHFVHHVNRANQVANYTIKLPEKVISIQSCHKSCVCERIDVFIQSSKHITSSDDREQTAAFSYKTILLHRYFGGKVTNLLMYLHRLALLCK